MSTTKIRGNTQIMDFTIDLDRLQVGFIGTSTGDWDITNGAQDALITGIKLQPINDSDVSSKWYVDQKALYATEWKASVQFATSTGGVGTYSPTGGVGGTGAFTSVDLTATGPFDFGSHTVLVGDRVLVKNQADAKQNGIYTVTSTGATGGLERALDQDGAPSAEVSIGNATYVENVTSGSTGTHWVVVKPAGYDGSGVLTLNVDNIDWTQFSGIGTYTAGDGIDISGTTISVDVTDIIDTAAGLTESLNNIQVNLDPTGGLGFNSGAIQITSAGIKDYMVDWGTSTGQVSAGDIPIADAGGYFAIDDVESALQQLGSTMAASYAFGTFVPTAGTSIVAEIGADTATLTASDGAITITGTALTDTLDFTITSSGIQDYMIAWGTSTGQVSAGDMPIVDAGNYFAIDNVEDALQQLGSGAVGVFSFNTISTPSGTSPVADSTADTLTLLSGGPITITGSSVADSVTFDIGADGIKDSHIDWGTSTGQVSAGDVPILDAGNYFTSTGVEGALQELAAATPGIGFTEVFGELPTLNTGAETATLAFTPINGTELVYLNGVRQIRGISYDYTIGTNVITFNSPGLQPNDIVLVDYRHL